MAAPPLAVVGAGSRSFEAVGSRRLDLHAVASRSYLRGLASAHRALQARIERAIPAAQVGWRYSIVLNGLAVSVPRGAEARLSALSGVARVWPSFRYRPLLDRTPGLIHATELWGGPTLPTGGNGIKIGIIDDGVDQTHPFFDPGGYAYPAGFPKGEQAYATPKVIVARAFPPPDATYARASLPFDSLESEHGTHVAGIAAGNAGTAALRTRISGIAPRAYLGNYKALTIPTPGFGLNGNSPELAAAVEAAVSDGMDVVNLSLGEPEIDPARDLVAQALDGAAQAGVVPVVAAGNEFDDFGAGSISSPGTAARAITAGASSGGHGSARADVIASFSSKGPTPYSLRLKPDVTAPGVQVLSSVPPREGLYAEFSGTSMASPHVAGGAALLRQRHPDWTVAEIKSALAQTGVPVRSDSGAEVSAAREGGGRIDLLRADTPLVFASPTGLSFGLVRIGSSAARTIELVDAGGGSGAWSASVVPRVRAAEVSVPSTVTVPGRLAVKARARAAGGEREVNGFVVLTRGADRRRIPFWFRASRPRLGLDPRHPLTRAGVHVGTTVGAGSRVSRYRYPDLDPASSPIPVRMGGPESVYRFRLRQPAANLGVAVVARGPGVRVEPRIVRAGNESRLAGFTALPLDLNPYRSSYGQERLVAGVIRPVPGVFDIVFDSTAGSRRGSFSFRFWVGDLSPPIVRVRSVQRDAVLLSVRDRGGAGVDASSFRATVGGIARATTYAGGIARVSLIGVQPGRHDLVVRVADYQETKNMENTGPILPNTRVFRTTIIVP